MPIQQKRLGGGGEGGSLKTGQGGDFCKISANYVQICAKGVQIYAKCMQIYPKCVQIYARCMQFFLQIVLKNHHSLGGGEPSLKISAP